MRAPRARVWKRLGVTCGLLSLTLSAGVARADDDKVPVNPFQLAPLEGADGKRWDLREDGAVNDGTSDCFDGGFELLIGAGRVRYEFQRRRRLAMQAMAGAGGETIWHRKGEELFFGPVPLDSIEGCGGLQYTRRIALTQDKQWLRYIEVFENTSDADREVTLTLQADYGSQIQERKGSSKKAGFTEADWGVGLIQRPGRPHVVRAYRSPHVRDFGVSLDVRGDNVSEVIGPITIPAGKTIAIAHFAAQASEEKDVDALMASFDASGLLGDLSFEDRQLLINFSSGMSLEGLNVPREPGHDLVVLHSGKTLVGTILDERFVVETIAGPQSVPLDMFVGLQTVGARESKRVLLGCRDRQIYAGELAAEAVSFELGGGQKLEILLSKIATLGRSSEDDAETLAKVKPPARFIVLRTGDHFGVADLAAPVRLVTRYGELSLPLGDIHALDLAPAGHWGHEVTLSNGSRFGCLVLSPELEVLLENTKGIDGAPPVALRQDLILRVESRQPMGEARLPAGVFALRMRNGDEMLCRLGTESLKLETEFGSLALSTRSIREASLDARGKAEVVQWDGTELEGRLERPLLELDVGGVALTVAVSLVQTLEQRTYQLPEALAARVRDLIAGLDAPAFDARDRAQTVLKSLGPVVRPYLDEALAAEGLSPEKSQRIQAILSDVGPSSAVSQVDVKALEAKLTEAIATEAGGEADIVRTLKLIAKAQQLYHDEDRDGDELQNFATLAELAEHLGAAHGIDEALGKGEKYGYLFESGPSTNERAAMHLWWAVARPKGGEGPSYFINHLGAVFRSDEAFEVNTETCGRPASATRVED